MRPINLKLRTLFIPAVLATVAVTAFADDYSVDSVTISGTTVTVNYKIVLDPQSSGHNPTFVLEHWRGGQLQSTPINQTDSLTVGTSCAQCVGNCSSTTPSVTIGASTIFGSCSIASVCSTSPPTKNCSLSVIHSMGKTVPVLDRGDQLITTITASGDGNSSNNSMTVTVP